MTDKKMPQVTLPFRFLILPNAFQPSPTLRRFLCLPGFSLITWDYINIAHPNNFVKMQIYAYALT